MKENMFTKLGIEQDQEVCVIEAPEGYPTDEIDVFTEVPGSSFDVVQIYVDNPDLFAQEVAEGVRIGKEDGSIWVTYPENDNSFSQDFMRQQGEPLGVAPAESVELGDGWTATKMVIQ